MTDTLLASALSALSLSSLAVPSSSGFLLLLQNLCVPGGSSGAFTALLYLLVLLTGLFPGHCCLNCHEFWTQFQIVKGMFSTEQTQRRNTASTPFHFILIPHPSREDGERIHSLGPERISNIRPFSISYTA